jgi:hypothetical protein
LGRKCEENEYRQKGQWRKVGVKELRDESTGHVKRSEIMRYKNEVVWTGSIWLRIGTSGGLL